MMVHSGVAFASERVVHEILDSTAFNVAMFAMGWAATRSWTRWGLKGNDPRLSKAWLKALAAAPRALWSPLAAPISCSGDSAECLKAAATSSTPCETCNDDACQPPSLSDGRPVLPSNDNQSDDASTLLAGVASLLKRRIIAIDMSEQRPWRRSTCFHNKEQMDMSIEDYLAHVHWYFECSSPCLVLAMIYLDRAVSGGKLAISADTCHRVYLASLLVALKFHDDDYTPYPNTSYARMGRVDVDELNAMEKQLCKSLDWNLYVKPEEYVRYRNIITHEVTTTAPTISTA
jgi:hypothetical protein